MQIVVKFEVKISKVNKQNGFCLILTFCSLELKLIKKIKFWIHLFVYPGQCSGSEDGM